MAVIGAGIVGVTTAHELALDGHEVTVLEQGATVAGGASFAHAGLVAPASLSWVTSGPPGPVRRLPAGGQPPLRLEWPRALGRLPWLWRSWRAGRPDPLLRQRGALWALALDSRRRLDAITASLQLDHERSPGLLVLWRTGRDLSHARPALARLSELGVPHALLDAAGCRTVEPGLNPELPLHAGLHLPEDGVANCRHAAQLLRREAQSRGATFRFGVRVDRIVPGREPRLLLRDGEGPREAGFDAVVLAAGVGSAALLRPLGLRLALAPVWGCSLTAPLRQDDAMHASTADIGPRSGLVDARHQVAVTRLGGRVRVAGGAALGGAAAPPDERTMATLHRVLDDCFPGAARWREAQVWSGARPTLAGGLPRIGASPLPGVWLNLGHGDHGWALACGSARLVADAIAGRTPALDAEPFAAHAS